MMNNRLVLVGVLCALGAAAANGLVGVFSKLSMNLQLDYAHIAFYKCFLGFLITLALCLSNKKHMTALKTCIKSPLPILICAFFGVFILYFFETSAYSHMKVSEVVLILMVGSTVASVSLSYYFLQEKTTAKTLFSLVLSFVGIYLIYGNNSVFSIKGAVLAFVSGIGYGSYLVVTRYFKIKSTLAYLCALFGFGCMYLILPLLYMGDIIMPSVQAFPYLLFLAVVPTIGGFYMTTKALEYLESSRVQLLELSEPVFALVFAFVILAEFLTLQQAVASSLIIFSLYLPEVNFRSLMASIRLNTSNKT